MNGWQIFVELTGRPPVEIRPGESLVGRSRTCQVHIPETTVSRQHARILSSALGDVTVEDLGSSNGTFVNGEKIEGRRKLADGDRILVGDAEMRMRIVAPVAATEATVRLTLPPLSQIAAAGAPPPMPAMPAPAAPAPTVAPAPIASSLPADDLDPWEKTPPAPLELPLEPPPAPRPAPPAPMAPPPAASVAETVFAPSPRPGAPPPMAPPPMAPPPIAAPPRTPPPSVAETVFAPSPRPGAPPVAAPPPAAPPASVAETVFAPSPRPGAPPPMAAPPPALVPPPPRPAPPPMTAPPPPPAAPVAATVAGAPRVMAAPPAPLRPIDPPLQTAPAPAPPRPAAPPARKDALGSVTVIDRIPIPEPPPAVLEAAKLERARPAGFWIRVAATLIDALPSVVVVTIGTVLGFVIHPMIPLLTNLIVLPYAFYVGLYMPAMQSTTIGKKMLGLRIVHPSVKAGAGLGWGIALLRVVGHMVCGFTLGIGYLLVAFTSQKQGLHDLIASTRVVRVR